MAVIAPEFARTRAHARFTRGAAAIAAAPLRGLVGIGEFIISEGLAPVLYFPVFLLLQLQARHAMTKERLQQRLTRERARRLNDAKIAALDTVVTGFDQACQCTRALEQHHAGAIPLFVETVETNQLIFAETHRRLRQAIRQATDQNDLVDRIDAIFFADLTKEES